MSTEAEIRERFEDEMLSALKVKEGVRDEGLQEALEPGKGKGTHSSLESPEGKQLC